MKSISSTYRFVALSLALLMFFSSVSFAVDMHYCQGQLKSLSFIGKAKNCHEMASQMANCPHHQQQMATVAACEMEDKDCCQNKTWYFNLDQDQVNQTADFLVTAQWQQFIIAYVAVFFQNQSSPKEVRYWTQYKPPLIPRDLPVLFESFLL